jgi:hypothetical protein
MHKLQRDGRQRSQLGFIGQTWRLDDVVEGAESKRVSEYDATLQMRQRSSKEVQIRRTVRRIFSSCKTL